MKFNFQKLIVLLFLASKILAQIDVDDKDSVFQKKAFEQMQRRNKNVSFSTNLTNFMGINAMNDISYANDTELQMDKELFKQNWIVWKYELLNSAIFRHLEGTAGKEEEETETYFDAKEYGLGIIAALFITLLLVLYIFCVYKFKNIQSINKQENILNLANIINVISLSIVLYGILSIIINLQNYRKNVWKNNMYFNDITFKHSQTPREIIQHLNLFNSLNLYDHEYQKMEFNLTTSFAILHQYQAKQVPSNVIQKEIQKSTAKEQYIFSMCTFYVIMLISLNINSLLSTQFNKRFKFTLGIIFYLMSIQLVMVSNYTFKAITHHIDWCEEGFEITQDQLPLPGHGWRLLFTCPEQQDNIQFVQRRLMFILNKSLIQVKIRLMETGYSEDIEHIQNIQQLNILFNQPRMQMDPYIVNFNAALNELAMALYKTQMIINCSYLKYYLKVQQTMICSNHETINFYKIISGLILISFSSFISSIACVQWYIINYKNELAIKARQQTEELNDQSQIIIN